MDGLNILYLLCTSVFICYCSGSDIMMVFFFEGYKIENWKPGSKEFSRLFTGKSFDLKSIK